MLTLKPVGFFGQCRSRLLHQRIRINIKNMTSGFSTKPTLAGVVQMTSTSDKKFNLDTSTGLICKAKERGAQMVFLPECFDYVSESQSAAIENSETLEGSTIKHYRCLAQRENVWLSLGGFHEKDQTREQSRIFNTHLIINNLGEIKGVYRKLHLFDVDIKGGVQLQETSFTIPGDSIHAPVETPVGKIGMAICYDLRFPEMSLALAQQGAEILTYPSAFTVPTGSAHWKVLLRSRAIETQCYVIAAAQVGRHNSKRSSYGHAMIIDPWGGVIAECKDQVDVIVGEIDLQYMSKRRKEMPVNDHRRHDLYGHIQIQSSCDIDNTENYVFGQYEVKSTSVFYRTALSYALVNRKPVLPGHVLISPIRCVPRFADLKPAEVSDMWNMAQKVAKVIEKFYDATSATFSIQDGPQAGQTVQHVHIHILPRKLNDFKENDDVYNKLEGHDKNVKPSEWRSDDDMALEASSLRKYFL